MTRRVVISAINIVEGGTLTVLRDCLRSAAASLPDDWEIIALVHDANLFDEPRIRLLEMPEAKESYWVRLRREWIDFKRLSLAEPVDLWLSMHDVTPRVKARRQAVYCQNALPFYSLSLKEALLEPRLILFNKVYLQVYARFIRRNDFVIVQQEWLRQQFSKLFKPKQIIVAHPTTDHDQVIASDLEHRSVGGFLFPALPRPFKNFETILKAARRVREQTSEPFEVRITVEPHENRYARYLYKRFGEDPSVRFLGRQTAEGMREQYQQASVILFPSKIESWGMPISEAKRFGKPIMVADEPYATETVGGYVDVEYLPTTNVRAWADAMAAHLEGVWKPNPKVQPATEQPFARDWKRTWDILVQGL